MAHKETKKKKVILIYNIKFCLYHRGFVKKSFPNEMIKHFLFRHIYHQYLARKTNNSCDSVYFQFFNFDSVLLLDLQHFSWQHISNKSLKLKLGYLLLYIFIE